jgi:hypothetical protein
MNNMNSHTDHCNFHGSYIEMRKHSIEYRKIGTGNEINSFKN